MKCNQAKRKNCSHLGLMFHYLPLHLHLLQYSHSSNLQDLFFPPPPMPPMMQQRMQFMHPPPPHMMPPPPGPPRIRFNNRFTRPPSMLLQGPSRQPPLAQTSKSGSEKISSEAMIQAKPQIRSLSADVTRFVPVSVKMKKDTGPSSSRPQWPPAQVAHPVQPRKSTKDDAYSEFMKEMEGLL